MDVATHARSRGHDERGEKDRVNVRHPSDQKKCSKCKQVKPLSEYWIRKSGRRYSSCKTCERNRYLDLRKKTSWNYDENWVFLTKKWGLHE